MKSRRTIITISDEDKLWLENYSRMHSISMAEAVRRGIIQLKERDTGEAYRRLVLQTRGIWKGEDGLRYQKKLRAEWG